MGNIENPSQQLDEQQSQKTSAGVFEEILKTRYFLINQGLLPEDQNVAFNFNQRLCCAVQNMFVEKFAELGYKIDTGNQSIQRWTLLLYFLSLNSVNLATQDIGLFTYLSSWTTGTDSSSSLFIPRGDATHVVSLGGDNRDKIHQYEFSQLYQQMATLDGPYRADNQQLDEQFLVHLSTQIDVFIAKYGEATQHFDMTKLQELARTSYLIGHAKEIQGHKIILNGSDMISFGIEKEEIDKALSKMSKAYS